VKFAVHIIVMEDTNESFEAVGELGAGTMESVLDIETEEQAIAIAAEIAESARSIVRLQS
jgi:hypothetical protein